MPRSRKQTASSQKVSSLSSLTYKIKNYLQVLYVATRGRVKQPTAKVQRFASIFELASTLGVSPRVKQARKETQAKPVAKDTTGVSPWSFINGRKVGLMLVVIGLGLLVFPAAYKTENDWGQRLRAEMKDKTVTKKISILTSGQKPSPAEPIKIDAQLLSEKEPSQPPQRIVIPALNLDLPVVEARVVNGFWEPSQSSASHGVGAANPGEPGNVVIFAHARDDLFGPLRNLKKDIIIYVLTKDRWYSYSTEDIKLVDPSDIQVIAPTPAETLTLYTCSGFLDTKRLIVTARPKR